jgi:hypothetical protein
MGISETVATIIGIASALLLIWQIRIGVRAFQLEHQRERQHETLNFMLQIRPLWHEALAEVDEQWGTDELTPEEVEQITSNENFKKGIKKLLGHLEYLCTAVNVGVLDEEILYRTSASHLIKIYNRFHAYIAVAQKRNAKAYCEFTSVIEEFRARKRREG